MPFRENVPLRDFCTLGIGGPARYFLEIRTVTAMQDAIAICHAHQLPFLVLGKGSNCLFEDRGVNGVVLINKIDFCEEPSPGVFYVGAGYSFALLGVHSARQGWGGLEFASGIPASVGGAVFMNAGANGQETAEYLDSVDFISEEGILKRFQREELVFSYRFSSFQNKCGAIVGATFKLKPSANARERQLEIIAKRTKTQPYGSKSAGCIFLNPLCGSAGALIESCNLKGVNVGGASVSTLHANFLINADNATCKEMLELIDLVKARVREVKEVELQSEVRQIKYELK